MGNPEMLSKLLASLEEKLKDKDNFGLKLQKILNQPFNTDETVSDSNTDGGFYEFAKIVKKKKNELLMEASKNGKEDIVDFLIKCGASVTYRIRKKKSAIDFAAKNNHKNIVLKLLKADSRFPQTDLDDKDFEKFKKDRDNLHELIKNNDLEEVKKITTPAKSKYYFNSRNKSAAFTALQSKNLHIYAYLVSIGVGLYGDGEAFEINKLSYAEKNNLREIMLKYFPRLKNSHIHFLLSKTQCLNARDINPEIKVEQYYNTLNEIENVNKILEVVQYVDKLQIVFDFNKNDVESVCGFLEDNGSVGVTFDDRYTVYIAAGPEIKDSQVLGTLAHELLHVAIYAVFKNNGLPYGKSDGKENEFRDLLERTKAEVAGEDKMSQCITDGFELYEEEKQIYELIVKVPEILAEFRGEGEPWLRNNVNDLFTFYLEYVIPKCQSFIEDSYLLKPRNIVSAFNENVGEIINLKRRNLTFKNLNNLQAFFSVKDIKYFFLSAINAPLNILRSLQGIYGPDFGDYSGHYLVLKLQACLENWDEFKDVFLSEATELLILSCCDDRLNEQAIINIMNLIQDRFDKKIVFVFDKKNETIFEGIIRRIEFRTECKMQIEADFSLDDLDSDSQEVILQKKIKFQGVKVTLEELMFGNKELLKSIDARTIGKLSEDKIIKLGNEAPSISSLDGAYAEIGLKVNVESMAHQLKESDDIFIITGIKGPHPKNVIADSLKEYVDTNEEIMKITDEILNLKKCKIFTKKIIVVMENVTDIDFRLFCQNQPYKKIYLIDVKNNELDSSILKEMYNPDFYISRMIRRPIVEFNDKEKLINSSPSEIFIISSQNNNFEVHNHVKDPNAKTPQEMIQILVQKGLAIHCFEEKNDLLIWKDSFGSANHINHFIDQTSTKIVDEEELIKEIRNKKVVIIADEPGMGKTTTLTMLHNSKVISNSNWIIRINLKDHINAVKQINPVGLSKQDVKDFLQRLESQPKNKLTEIFFDAALDRAKKFSEGLLFTFDGFDELLDEEDRKKVISLIKFLKNQTKCKIWITTRLQHKTELEKELLSFSWKFEALDEVQVIEKHLQDRLMLILSRKQLGKFFRKKDDRQLQIEYLETLNYIYQFIGKMREIYQIPFTLLNVGLTPLQWKLMLENSVENFKDFIENDVPYSRDQKSDLVNICEKLIKRKYDIYFEKKNTHEKLEQELIKEVLENCHLDLAEFFFNPEKNQSRVKKYKDLMLLVGLVQCRNGNLQFSHFPFREYYSAQVFLSYFTKNVMKTKLAKYFINKVLVNKNHNITRRFIEFQLKKLNMKNFIEKNSKNLKNFGKVFRILWCKKSKEELRNTMLRTPAFHIAAKEDNTNLFKLLIECAKSNFEDIHYYFLLALKPFGRSCFHYAAMNQNLQILDSLFEILNESRSGLRFFLLSRSDTSGETPFHEDVSSGGVDYMKYFSEKVKTFMSIEDRNKFIMMTGKRGNDFILAAKLRNLELLDHLISEEENIVLSVNRKIFYGRKNIWVDLTNRVAAASNDTETFNLLQM